MHHWILFLVALRAFVRWSQMPLKELNFVKTLVRFGGWTYFQLWHPYHLWQSTVYNETITNIGCNYKCNFNFFWNSLILDICSIVQSSALDPWFKVQIVWKNNFGICYQTFLCIKSCLASLWCHLINSKQWNPDFSNPGLLKPTFQ